MGNKEDVAVEEKMLMTFVIALAKKLEITPVELADLMVSGVDIDYLTEFTLHFGLKTVEKMMEKKANKSKEGELKNNI